VAKRLREISCKILGHEAYDKETLRVRPWTWGEFRGYGSSAFAHKNCLRCDAPIDPLS